MKRELENRAFENASELVGLVEINPTEKNEVNGGLINDIFGPIGFPPILCCYNIPPFTGPGNPIGNPIGMPTY